MACKNCGGVAQPKFNGEMGITLSDLKKIKIPPVYVCSSLLVCMDCGFAELMVPVTELESLRGMAFPSQNP